MYADSLLTSVGLRCTDDIMNEAPVRFPRCCLVSHYFVDFQHARLFEVPASHDACPDVSWIFDFAHVRTPLRWHMRGMGGWVRCCAAAVNPLPQLVDFRKAMATICGDHPDA